MPNTLVINSNLAEVRVALLEDRQPVEVYIERTAERGVVGNIYRGHVVRVLPGMQAAFVDVGLERTGFLYVNDAVLPPFERAPERPVAEPDPFATSDGEEDTAVSEPPAGRAPRAHPVADIASVLSHGQDILVQVQREPLGAKGARLTRHITVPGRYLVFMPFSEHIGVSHRVASAEERERLRHAMVGLAPAGSGFIIRTAAEGQSIETLKREAEVLQKVWQDIERQGKEGASPRLIFEDLNLVLRATRDLFTGQVDRIVVDNAKDAERIKSFVENFAVDGHTRVEFYDAPEPIFDHFGVEVEIERALERRVWLKSGGTIVIDQAEALTVIDVNSGRFVGTQSLEDTITKINLEAVKEVAFQLRLRNLGGIIIIDFIDMVEPENRARVLQALEEELKRDKAKTTIVRMSELGLVEMTRKRVRDSLGHMLTEPCPYCKGRAYVKSEKTVANEILRALRRTLARTSARRIVVKVDTPIADYLCEDESWQLEELEREYHANIVPVARDGSHREQYEIVVDDDAETDPQYRGR
jgi:ribonuclease G